MGEPTDDERAGMAWWNALTEAERREWLDRASAGGRRWDASPADAWREYKRAAAAQGGHP